MAQVKIKIDGMRCGGCAGAIENVLKQIDGVESAESDIPSKITTVTVRDNVSTQELLSALENANFPGVLM